MVLAEAEEVEPDLLGDAYGLERVADRLGGGAVAAVGGAGGVAEGVDAEFKGIRAFPWIEPTVSEEVG